jgi:hypothetical protein
VRLFDVILLIRVDLDLPCFVWRQCPLGPQCSWWGGNDERVAQTTALLHDFGGPLADDDAGSRGISRRDAGHDKSVGSTKMFDAIDLPIVIHDGHGISAHFGCAGFMPVTDGHVAHELLQFWLGHVSRQDFALDKLL